MRLDRLHLEKYGAFTARRLDFAPQARLHVVFGANEAGKTTALSAVTDLLYGIEERTAYNFQHANDEMRLAAAIRGRDGRTLEFRRRKGRKNTLLDPQDKALPDEELTSWLAGIDRGVFTNAFGLSQDGLRLGGRAMLAADGEVGRSLFAAASGMTHLVDMGKALGAEAEKLFKKGSRGTTAFDELRRNWDEARRAVRDHSVSFDDWNERVQAVKADEARDRAIAAERADLARERSRLERLRRTRPILTRIETVIAALGEVAGLPELPEGFAASIGTCLDRLATGEENERRLARQVDAVAQRLALVRREPDLVAVGTRIDRLVESLKALKDIEDQLPHRQKEADGATAELDRLARELGLPDGAELLRRTPADGARRLAGHLIAGGRSLVAEAGTLRLRHARAVTAVAEAEAAKIAAGAPDDPVALRRQLSALRPGLESIAKRHDLAARIARDSTVLAERLAALRPALPAAMLMSVPLPATEWVGEMARRRQELAQQVTTLAAERRALDADIVKQQRALARLVAGRALPTPAALAEARAERDRLWQAARAVVRRDPGAVSDAEARTALAAGIDRAIPAADALADRRDAEGARLAQHTEITRQLDERAEAAAALGRRAADLADDTAAFEREWTGGWTMSGIPPAAPADMQRWLGDVATLRGQRLALGDLEAARDALDRDAAEIAPPLEGLAATLGLDIAGLPLGGAATAIDQAINDLVKTWQAARDAAQGLAGARRVLDGVAAELAGHADREAAWRADWTAAMPSIGLSPMAGLDAADDALAVWAKVPAIRERRVTAQDRIDGMRATRGAMVDEVTDLVARTGTGPADAAPLVAIESLRDRLDVARKAESEGGHLAQQLATARSELETAATAVTAARTVRDRLAAQGGVADGEGLRLLADRLRRRTALQEDLAERRRELAEQGDGLGEAELRAEQATLAVDDVAARLTANAAEDADRVQELTGLRSRLDRTAGELAAMESGHDAAEAAQQEATAIAGMADLARRYALAEAARLLVSAALERHRARYQNPLLERASTVFAGLTGQRYARLALDYRGDDRLVLVAERPGGQRVAVDGLSEGTRDQLYLALRLAALAAFAAQADPLPFICDDLLVSFDDVRAANGLRALAEAGAEMQVVLFTHHGHIVDLARHHLGAAVDVIEL